MNGVTIFKVSIECRQIVTYNYDNGKLWAFYVNVYKRRGLY